ncbi:protein spaetzle-like [Homarus americanus]|uniref:protein spaetzle-like n=1 Tax=Homarus americanus TaxID=6706 RepID=UPI001C469D80|nr:protein spaetzle-like [Homarus americanus]
MAMRCLIVMSAVAVAMADITSHVSSHVVYSGARPQPYPSPHSTYPQYSPYHPPHSIHPHPPPPYTPEPEVPVCAANTNATWCLEDDDYPEDNIKQAIKTHFPKFSALYADVPTINTKDSVDRPETLEEETYLCPSETAYIRPLRAQNTDDKWRVIVNDIEAHYETFTQTTRIEECLTSGDACPLVPECYESKCLQKSIYHRFLVYDPYDQYFPFAIETFKLPASCACLLGAYTIDH